MFFQIEKLKLKNCFIREVIDEAILTGVVALPNGLLMGWWAQCACSTS
jgi:hypothetical protein